MAQIKKVKTERWTCRASLGVGTNTFQIWDQHGNYLPDDGLEEATNRHARQIEQVPQMIEILKILATAEDVYGYVDLLNELHPNLFKKIKTVLKKVA